MPHLGKQALPALFRRIRPLLAASLLAGAIPAAAHVNYIDLSNPLVSPGGVNGSSFSNYGWWDGTRTTLGDSHDLAGGDFFRFHLDQTSRVSITFSDLSGSGLLNPAFTVYRGLLPDEAHDDALVDPLNPRALVPPFPKVASPVDDGVTTDFAGRVSPLRDTVNVTFVGQFNALASWSMANESGDWTVLEYVTHVGPAGGNSVALTSFVLGPGDYTIAAAGGTNVLAPGAPPQFSGIDGELRFAAAPVPEPAAGWMFAAGLLAVTSVLRSRRRRPTA